MLVIFTYYPSQEVQDNAAQTLKSDEIERTIRKNDLQAEFLFLYDQVLVVYGMDCNEWTEVLSLFSLWETLT